MVPLSLSSRHLPSPLRPPPSLPSRPLSPPPLSANPFSSKTFKSHFSLGCSLQSFPLLPLSPPPFLSPSLSPSPPLPSFLSSPSKPWVPISRRRREASCASVLEGKVGGGEGGEVGDIGEAILGGKAVGGDPIMERDGKTEVVTEEWIWEGYKIRYQKTGSSGPPLLLIHGFGANCDHWRKNLPVLGLSHRVFAIDLLGYGFSDKPDPRGKPPNSLYTFDTWSRQVLSFIDEVIGEATFVVCNSVGGNVGLKASLDDPPKILGLLLLNISLRQLHIKKQQWYIKPFVKALQTTLRTTEIGRAFFASVAKPDAVKRILKQCYFDQSQVTDELVRVILEPGLQKGAVDVFLDFICYSGGPLPEDMLPLVKCPVVIGWGEEDPWEPVSLGKLYGNFSTVEEFVILPGVGHCPQDEAPHLVNPLIERFVAKYS